jgi:hypothetical protein
VQAPTSIPILESTRIDGLEIGWIALHLYPDEFTLRYAIRGFDPNERCHPLTTVSDARGRVYEPGGGGGGGDDEWRTYRWEVRSALPEDASSLHVDARISGARVEAVIPVRQPERRGTADVLRSEKWPSPRWDSTWIPSQGRAADERTWASFSHATLPDEIVPLGAVAGDVAGGTLTFLSLERWGGVWQLHHHWRESGARMYSPLEKHYLELDVDGTTTIATGRGGGTEGCGCRFAHDLVAESLPDRFVVRRPAADGGPPLVEAEVLIGA